MSGTIRRCESCDNEYDRTFEVRIEGRSHVFDSFECAINRLAPRCVHCDNIVIGHGVQVERAIFCSAHCARGDGREGVIDRAERLKK